MKRCLLHVAIALGCALSAFAQTKPAADLIIENAHRFVYASTENPLVSEIHPRVVNAAAFESETSQWLRWGKEQSQAERDLNSPPPQTHRHDGPR